MATLSFGTPPAKIWISMKGASRNVHILEKNHGTIILHATNSSVIRFLFTLSTRLLNSQINFVV